MKFLINAVNETEYDCFEKYIKKIQKNGYKVEVKKFKQGNFDTVEYYIEIKNLDRLYNLTKIVDCNVCMNQKQIVIYDIML